MTDITFCRTRHVYDSYTDFWRLVELSGFPTIYVDEIKIDEPGVYITSPMNGDYEAHLKNELNRQVEYSLPRMAHLILWNLERPSHASDGYWGSMGQYNQRNEELLYARLLNEIWVSDTQMAHDSGHTCRYVTLGSDYGLGEPGEEKQYDLVHMSAIYGRRVTIYNDFSNIGANSWGDERHQVLQRSKFALNIHQDNYSFQEPLRKALFAAYGLPIISETCYDQFPFQSGDTAMFFGYNEIVNKAKEMIHDDYDKWVGMGEKARKMLCENYQFGRMVRRAVKESIGEWR